MLFPPPPSPQSPLPPPRAGPLPFIKQVNSQEIFARECSGDLDELCCRTQMCEALARATLAGDFPSVSPSGGLYLARQGRLPTATRRLPSQLEFRLRSLFLNVFLDSNAFKVYFCRKSFLN